MITILYDKPVNLQDCNLQDVLNFLTSVFFVASYFLWPKSGGHNVFHAAKLPIIWLKIPKLVIVTDSPLSSLKYLMYLAEMCCDSKNVLLVGRRSWSRSCHFAVGVVGVVGTFSLPYICHSLCRFPYNLCALRQ